LRAEIGLAQASVRLQELRVTEANGGIRLAELQQDRAQIQIDTYEDWLQRGANESENEMIYQYRQGAAAQKGAAIAANWLQYQSALQSAISIGSQLGSLGPVGIGAGALVGTLVAGFDIKQLTEQNEDTLKAIDARLQAQIASANATLERRKDEWQLQKLIAEQDRRIGEQQIEIARDHVDVVEQEKAIARLQVNNAQETLNFLTTQQFGTEELYDLMNGVLERVYRYFLQQATSMAKLAENQLAFERQELPPAFIQSDYWQLPAEGDVTNADRKGPDRRGMTGSARLLQDIYQLDQHAFETNKRKLQLGKVLSLARLAPFEFQRFRETGIATFATPLELFYRDFPGHYLRLIKRMRTSVIALVPPNEGIRATLSTSGLSRVVIGPDVFQTIPIRRDPELVALTSPINSSGVFELEAQSEMLLPFEGNGVDTVWEFRMPKAANPFDYRTIADVQLRSNTRLSTVMTIASR
jgi:hypothetical protein